MSIKILFYKLNLFLHVKKRKKAKTERKNPNKANGMYFRDSNPKSKLSMRSFNFGYVCECVCVWGGGGYFRGSNEKSKFSMNRFFRGDTFRTPIWKLPPPLLWGKW